MKTPPNPSQSELRQLGRSLLAGINQAVAARLPCHRERGLARTDPYPVGWVGMGAKR